jgi:hypothetical protein
MCATISYGLKYVSNNDVKLQGYTYFDWEGSEDDRKSTPRFFFNLGSAMVSWTSRKEKFVALNTA